MRKTKKTLLILTGLLSLSALASCGEQGPQGIPGKDGQDGLNGTDGKDGQDGVDGKDGADGSKIYTGSGEPGASLGVTGDIYIDVDTGDLYSKGESWIKTGNIKGDKGDAGTDGKDGSDGSDGTDGQNGKDGEDGRDGEDGVSITSVMKTSTDGNTDTYTIFYSDGSTSFFTVTNGADGQPGAQGEKGADGHTPTVTIGENGNWYVDGRDTGMKAQGPQGEKGDAGSDGVSIVVVAKTSSEGNFDVYTIFYSDGSTSTFTITNGIDGEDGRTPEITVDSDGCWCVDGVSSGVKAQGEKGDAGRGIASIVAGETSSDGYVEYTITYTDGSTSTFKVYNGKDGANGVTPFIGADDGYWYIGDECTGVKAQGEKGEKGDKGDAGRSVTSIEKTSSDGNVDTYTIAYSDGTASTFIITNGADGSQGIQGEPGQDGHTPTITIGDNGNWFIDDADTGISAKGEKGDKGDTGVSVTKAYIDDNGDLICEMSDGTTINAGHVKDVTKHTVNFHVDDEVIQTLSVEDGAKISVPSKEATAGYTVKSWHVTEDGYTYDWSFPGNVVSSDLDLYADFDYNTYTVTYVDEKYGTSIDPLTVTYDQAYSLSEITGKTGYTHADWKDGNGKSYGFSGEWRTAGDVTLYAQWPANQYTVTLDPNKGSVAKTKITVTYDSQYELPTPTRENYVFLGWYDSSDKKVSSKATWKGTESVTYTAKWTNVQNTYNFDAGDGTCDTYSMQIGWEDAYTLPTPTAPTYDGADGEYAFDGWFLGDTLVAQSGDSWTYSNQGGTLIAHYTCKKDIAGSTPAVDAENRTVAYGIYPQTRVSDENLIECLNVWTSDDDNDWYLLDGEYYAKKEADPYSSSYVFDDGTTIVEGTTYWFKCEPITWKILSSSDGEYSLVSTVLLDAHRYNEYYSGAKNGYYANNYKNSEIRAWLNGGFYDSAFYLGNSLIQTTTVDNSASTTNSSSNRYACANTKDKVFLPSYQVYKNAAYFADSTARQCKTTDWARANGASYSTDSSYLYNGWYWTRSPSSSLSSYAWFVGSDGDLSYNYRDVSLSYTSVRPGLRIKVAQ